jgi:hypothetical protein
MHIFTNSCETPDAQHHMLINVPVKFIGSSSKLVELHVTKQGTQTHMQVSTWKI